MTGSLASVDPHAGSHEIVGGRALDAAEPSHGVQPDACLVCGRTDRRQLHRVSLTAQDMAAAGLGGLPPVVCLTHYAAAMRSVGTPTPTGNCPRCIACGFDDPGYFGPVAVFPLQSGIPVTQPVYRACARHLAEAIAALTLEAPA